MNLRLLGLGMVAGALVAGPAHAAVTSGVLISEVVFNEVGSTADGEWIEIFNTGPTTVDLTNYKIGDEETSGGTSTTEALFQFPSGASIAPGEVQVISGGATRFFTVYGFNPTYETADTDPTIPNLTNYTPWDTDGGILNMANTNDQAVLVDGTDTIIDAASFGSTFAFNPALVVPVLDGQSYQRINAYVDTDTANDWAVVGTADDASSARSTPGVVPTPEPASLALAGLAAVGLLGRRRH